MAPLPQRPLILLLSAGAMLALGACAQTDGLPARDVSALSPLELVGLTVQSADTSRTLGNVDDVVLTPDNRVEQVIIATGAPMHTTERNVVVNTTDLRYAPNRQAVLLVGLSPTQFAALPVADDHMLSMGPTVPTNTLTGAGPMTHGGLEPTNWTNATGPR